MRSYNETAVNFLLKLAAVIIIILACMVIFRYYIEKQEPLNIDKLNDMVEREIKEIHGKN